MAYFTITPGYTFAANEILTIAKLNALGQPVISPTTDLFDTLTSFKNGFINGNFQLWQRGTSSKSCPAAAKTWRADRWFARPGGAACTYARSTSVPTGSIAVYSALLTGATSVTTVDFGQRIESADATTNWQRARMFSAWIYNDTGASFAPKLRIATPSVADTYTTNTTRLDVSLQSCPAATWTQVEYAFDGAGAAFINMANGCEVCIQIPDGSLNSAGKSVKITQIQCEPGTVVTAQEPRLYGHELQMAQRYCFALNNQVLGFATDATNLPNKGIFPYPTTMRVKPVFDGNNTAIGDGTNDLFTVTAGSAGIPVISGYAAEVMFACANNSANWTANAQVNITCVLTAEDQT